MLNRNEAIAQMNAWGRMAVPFVFFTDFEGKTVWLNKWEDVPTELLLFDFNGKTNASAQSASTPIDWRKEPVPKAVFSRAFQQVMAEIHYGNSFLTNLTFETKLEMASTLEDIFHVSHAKYKICYPGRFVCFSPEIFVRMQNGRIHSYPMKGTIDATLPDAAQRIVEDPKELAEHVTIVDLIRNDLSAVATGVQVARFRYIDEILSRGGRLLQVSSEIVGNLPDHWQAEVGDILFSLLPAGSICGAPKPKTVEIIREVETHHRGFYTGICGIFDGQTLDSGVMIRFIEKRDNDFFFKSGGGITAFSDLDKEYAEYLQKIYLPTRSS